jgi:DNA polymerase-3 subunit alpha
MAYMILDLETSGLPQRPSFGIYYNYTDISKYENSRPVQIGYIICDKHGKEIKRKSAVIKPLNFTITNYTFHGITDKYAREYGEKFKEVANELREDLKKVSIVVGHNINFDKNVLLSELFRRKCSITMERLLSKKFACTMEMAKDTYARHSGNIRKHPTLAEAYLAVTGSAPNIPLHDAMNDCIICAEIYKSLKK